MYIIIVFLFLLGFCSRIGHELNKVNERSVLNFLVRFVSKSENRSKLSYTCGPSFQKKFKHFNLLNGKVKKVLMAFFHIIC